MFGKKSLICIGAALVSAISIPAIGATISHRAKKHALAHPVKHAVLHVVKATVKTTAKPVTHVKPSVLVVHHAKKTRKSATKLAKSAKLTNQPQIGVLAMHSGHGTMAAPVKSPGSHLLAATVKVKTGK
jgi:hypothetical protein